MNEQERIEWLEKRKKCITGTDISAIAGMNPWRSQMDVYCDKLGLTEATPDNPAMEWGRRLEDVVAQRYSEQNGVDLAPGEWTVRDNWMGATPDRLIVGVNRGLEIKTAGLHTSKNWGESGTDEIPDHYALQCAWYMAVCERDEWDLAVLIGGQDYRQYNLKRSLRLENRLIELATQFRERHILTQTPPAIDGSKGASEYLKAVFPKDRGPDLIATTPEIDELVTSLIAARSIASQVEAQVADLENKIKAAIGEAPGMMGAWGKVTWKASKESSKTDWKNVAAALNAPKDVIEKYTTVSPGARRFLLSVNKQ